VSLDSDILSCIPKLWTKMLPPSSGVKSSTTQKTTFLNLSETAINTMHDSPIVTKSYPRPSEYRRDAILYGEHCKLNLKFSRAASMKMAVFWVVAQCSLVEVYRRFTGTQKYTALQPRRSHLKYRKLLHVCLKMFLHVEFGRRRQLVCSFQENTGLRR
jgi:hypothetical protein